MGATYWMLPRITGRELRFKALAVAQPYLWFGGMALFSTAYHIAGLRGLPRRVYSASLTGEYTQWHGLSLVAAVGAVILFISALSFVLVSAATWLSGTKIAAPAFEFATPLRPAVAGIWDRFGLWASLAVLIVMAAYARLFICSCTRDMDRRRISPSERNCCTRNLKLRFSGLYAVSGIPSVAKISCNVHCYRQA
jgi:cytochrome c oxidase subunit 1